MASWLDNLELGAAGVTDLASQGLSTVTFGAVPPSHYAAQVYAEQTAPNDAAAQAVITQQASAKEDAGALQQAAHDTVEQVGDAVTSWGKRLLWIGGGIAGVAVVAVAVVRFGGKRAA